jgi:hypothetical protein
MDQKEIKQFSDDIIKQSNGLIKINNDDQDQEQEQEQDQDNEIADDIDEIKIESKYADTIRCVFTMFLTKYEQLNNYDSRKIIIEMCKVAVETMSDHANNPLYYLKFLESSIEMFVSENTFNEISKETLK